MAAAPAKSASSAYRAAGAGGSGSVSARDTTSAAGRN